MTTADLLTALGLVLVIEGLLFAVHPAGTRRMMAKVQSVPDGLLRWAGVASAAAGVVVVWLVRG